MKDAALGVLFVLRGALQGLGRTLVPTLSGVLELVMRIGAALLLGGAFGFAGIIWGNPLAWIGSVLLLVPAYVVCHRSLGRVAIADTSLPTATPDDGPVVVRKLHRVRPRRMSGGLPRRPRNAPRRPARSRS